MTDSRLIAKNTVYMYIRMILIMMVSIYTSRVVMDKLGIDDFGLYSAVASVIAIVSFLNQTLSTSTSRFLAYDIGKENETVLKITFSTAFFSHLFLAFLITIIMESIGLWYMTNHFVIPEGRESATLIVYQLAIIITAISICVVPYKGLIVAYEDMGIYAYIGILEAVAQLAIAYMIVISPMDKLVSYASLLLIVQILITSIYIFICLNKYSCSYLKLYINKVTLKKMIGFSGWTAIANLSNTLTIQGSILLLNLFFSPTVIAAKAIADQVTSAVNMFINNFRTALNPSIIKTFAAEEYAKAKKMTLVSTILSFDLILVLGLPFVFTMDSVLHLWLVEVPSSAVLFTQIAIISQIFGSISTSTYIAFISSGKLGSNAICGIITGLAYFIILYIIFVIGGDPVWTQYLALIFSVIWVLILRPIYLHRDVGYRIKEIMLCYWSCVKVLIPSVILSIFLSYIVSTNISGQILLFLGVALICIICSYLFMEKQIRELLSDMFMSSIQKYINKKMI